MMYDFHSNGQLDTSSEYSLIKNVPDFFLSVIVDVDVQYTVHCL